MESNSNVQRELEAMDPPLSPDDFVKTKLERNRAVAPTAWIYRYNVRLFPSLDLHVFGIKWLTIPCAEIQIMNVWKDVVAREDKKHEHEETFESTGSEHAPVLGLDIPWLRTLQVGVALFLIYIIMRVGL